MFTGLVQVLGEVVETCEEPSGRRLTVRWPGLDTAAEGPVVLGVEPDRRAGKRPPFHFHRALVEQPVPLGIVLLWHIDRQVNGPGGRRDPQIGLQASDIPQGDASVAVEVRSCRDPFVPHPTAPERSQMAEVEAIDVIVSVQVARERDRQSVGLISPRTRNEGHLERAGRYARHDTRR